MIKQYLQQIIVACAFFLTILSAQANSVNAIALLDDDKPNMPQMTDVTQQNIPVTPTFRSEGSGKIYPNPVYKGGLLTIEMPVNRGELTIFLYNTVGKVIQTFKTTDQKIEFNAPDVCGIYLLRFVEKQKVIAVEKIVVK